MNTSGPLEAVFDANVIIGDIKETLDKEAGDESRVAFEALRVRPYHILRISKEIIKECKNYLEKEGLPASLLLKILFGPFELKEKIKKIEYKKEDIEIKATVPYHDLHVAEAAVAVKGKRKGIIVCLVTKNFRDFNPDEWKEKHDILVLSPKEYVDP